MLAGPQPLHVGRRIGDEERRALGAEQQPMASGRIGEVEGSQCKCLDGCNRDSESSMNSYYVILIYTSSVTL